MTHPDIFNDEQAAEYLGLKGPRSMETIQKNFNVFPMTLPGERKWHRSDLDAVVNKARSEQRLTLPADEKKDSNRLTRGRKKRLTLSY
ncbi:MAG: hypothetical protein ACF8OB_09335 [Phycisphaeraceae bacterium JB051]